MKNPELKKRLHNIVFESDTPAGKLFDTLLITVIFLSVLTVILESTLSNNSLIHIFYIAEWLFTVVFIFEYALRLYIVEKPTKYIFSFYGVVDLLSCLPTLISLFVPGAQSLLVIRALRLLRIFRIFKLTSYFQESMTLYNALKASQKKIIVFLFSIIIIVVLAGSAMYLVEGPESGFTNIPTGMYWAIVTLTTVGYGDLSPQSDLGRFIASIIMILGYAIIAVPTGIVTSELTKRQYYPSSNACTKCGSQSHISDAEFCYKCGAKLPAEFSI